MDMLYFLQILWKLRNIEVSRVVFLYRSYLGDQKVDLSKWYLFIWKLAENSDLELSDDGRAVVLLRLGMSQEVATDVELAGSQQGQAVSGLIRGAAKRDSPPIVIRIFCDRQCPGLAPHAQHII